MSQFITPEEMVPGREFGFMGFKCYWTGWKQVPWQAEIVGQWIAIDPKTYKGYSYALPGRYFSEYHQRDTYRIDSPSSVNTFKLNTEPALRNQMVSHGKLAFKKMIDKAERSKIISAMEENKPENYYGGQTSPIPLPPSMHNAVNVKNP